MLKVDLDKKRNRVKIEAAGSGLEIIADVAVLIREIHKSMGPDSAKFKEIMQKCIADEESPVWADEEKTGKETDGVKRVRFVFPGMPE